MGQMGRSSCRAHLGARPLVRGAPSLVVTTHSCACFRSSTPAAQSSLISVTGAGPDGTCQAVQSQPARCTTGMQRASSLLASQVHKYVLAARSCSSVGLTRVESELQCTRHKVGPAMTAHSLTTLIAFSNSTYSMLCSHPCNCDSQSHMHQS